MLELKELYKTFNPGTINAKTALNGLSLTLNDGDFVTVIGGNGAGKSTMLNATAGTFFVDSGKVIIDGVSLQSSGKSQRKLLELLKALVAFGGEQVNIDKLSDALWPDAEGGLARSAFA